MANLFKDIKGKIDGFRAKNATWFFIIAVVVFYLLYKFVAGIIQKIQMQKATAQVNASNAAIQQANTATGANSVRGELMQGIARSIKQVVDNYGFYEKYISFNPTPYIQDVNRMNGAAEAIYASQWYNVQYGRSLKADLQMIAYSEGSLFGDWTAKGGRYSDIKKEVQVALF